MQFDLIRNSVYSFEKLVLVLENEIMVCLANRMSLKCVINWEKLPELIVNKYKFGPTAQVENAPLCKSLLLIQWHGSELIIFTMSLKREINKTEITLSPSAVVGLSIQQCSSQLYQNHQWSRSCQNKIIYINNCKYFIVQY